MKQFLGTHKIGRILGFEVEVQYILYIFTGMMLLYRLQGVSTAGLAVVIVLATLLLPVFVLLHELGHSLAAYKEAVPVQRILLHPLGGLAILGGRIPGPMAEIMIALAGPFVSLLLAALSLVPLLLFGGDTPFVPRSYVTWFFYLCFYMNIIVTLFNLLPVFPLDGGRVALAIAVMRMGPARAVPAMKTISRVGLVILGLVGVVLLLQGQGGVMLILLAVVLYVLGGQEMQARQYAGAYAGGMSGGFGPSAAREPWAMPDWSPERGFASPPDQPAESKPGWFQRWRQERAAQKTEKEQAERTAMNQRVDAILAKVKKDGIGSLSPEEKDILNKASQQYRG